jgi:hypothetical protein
MTRYRSGRLVARALAFVGWALALLSGLLLLAGLFRLANPLLVALNVPALSLGVALGLALVLCSHLARALFDVADASLARSGPLAEQFVQADAASRRGLTQVLGGAAAGFIAPCFFGQRRRDRSLFFSGYTTHQALRVKPGAQTLSAPAPPASRVAQLAVIVGSPRFRYAARVARGLLRRGFALPASATVASCGRGRPEHRRRQSPPNNSSKPNPLRGFVEVRRRCCITGARLLRCGSA